MLIGELIRDWRTLQRKGAREVARKIGISHSTLCRVENDEPMDGATLSRIMLWVFNAPDEPKKASK